MNNFVLGLCVLIGACGAALAAPPTPPPAAPAGMSGAALLPALVEHSRHTATIEAGRLKGQGADFLRELGRDSQFVLIAEDHGVAGIAEFTDAYWRDLNETGFEYLAIETDPWVAAALERELRAGGPQRLSQFLAKRGGAGVVPFFYWASEAGLANTVVQNSSAPDAALWGLDQVYHRSVHWLLGSIAENARSKAAREAASRLAAVAEADRDWIAKSDVAELEQLRAQLGSRADRAYAELVDGLIVSQHIYRPFFGQGGEAYLSNKRRETLMKQQFLTYYRAAEKKDRADPRVMFKFGAYHMYRGATPTHVQGLGGFVTEFAVANDSAALSVWMICGPGSFVRSGAEEIPCTDWFNREFAFLAPYTATDGFTIFDLRSWRMRPGRWARLPENFRQGVRSFDVMVVVAGSPPASALPGLE